MAACLIGLGCNLGDRRLTLDWASRRLDELPGTRIVAVSGYRETVPVGGPVGQGLYLNAAALVETSLAPEPLLQMLRQIEHERGRQDAARWGPRELDLDVLLYDRVVLRTPKIVVPHPRMAWRRFVLEPAAEIAAEMVHPTTGWTIAQLLAHLDTTAPYVAIAGPIGVGKTHLATMLARDLGTETIAEEFDPARLEAFYANPTGNAWAVEIEFLEQRARLLAIDSPRWTAEPEPHPERVWVSDFWFDQALAYADVWLSPDRVEAFRRRWRQARARVQSPRLTVLLDAPAESLVTRIRRRGRSAEQNLDASHLVAIRQAILAVADEPGRGPILRLAHDDTDRVVAEVSAAIEAMK